MENALSREERALAEERQVATHKLDFRLWKAVGDELIFSYVVRSEYEVYEATRVWLHAVQQCFSVDLPTNSKAQRHVGLKASAFLATFPDPDSLAVIPTQFITSRQADEIAEQAEWRRLQIRVCPVCGADMNSEKCSKCGNTVGPLVDRVGPSVDIGFRVAHSATTRHFTMSAEVAYAVLHVLGSESFAMKRDKKGDVREQFMLKEMDNTLKGVWEGKSYPVFAWDVRGMPYPDEHSVPGVDLILRKVRKKTREKRVTDLTDWQALLSLCFDDEAWPTHIYLEKSHLPVFSRKPSSTWQAYFNQLDHPIVLEVPSEPLAGKSLPPDIDMGGESSLSNRIESELVDGFH